MRTASITAVASLVSLTLVVACGSESGPLGFKLQAMSFANSEWSEPVNLGAVVNSNVFDAAPTLSKDGLSLYLTSTRPGGYGGDDPWGFPPGCGDCPPRNPGKPRAAINKPPTPNKTSPSGGRHPP